MENVDIIYGHLEYLMAICYTLVYLVVICYIFPSIGLMYQEKSGNPERVAEHHQSDIKEATTLKQSTILTSYISMK
jgi:hypothetical protein